MNWNSVLKEYYKAYLAWVDSGAGKSKIFHRDCGLCPPLRNWAKQEGFSYDDFEQLDIALKNQFIRAALNPWYPFSPINQSVTAETNLMRIAQSFYLRERDLRECHLNPLRMQWVKDHV